MHPQLAVIFELLGAFLLGRTITGTIQAGIADINVYTRDPQARTILNPPLVHESLKVQKGGLKEDK